MSFLREQKQGKPTKKGKKTEKNLIRPAQFFKWLLIKTLCPLLQ